MTETARHAVEQRIKRVVRERLEIDLERLEAPEDASFASLGFVLDSIEALSLAVAIEKEFGVHIGDDDLTADLFHSVRTLADYVMRHQA
jgi:acyl carrier protein